jgi:hypothetical protein
MHISIDVGAWEIGLYSRATEDEEVRSNDRGRRLWVVDAGAMFHC